MFAAPQEHGNRAGVGLLIWHGRKVCSFWSAWRCISANAEQFCVGTAQRGFVRRARAFLQHDDPRRCADGASFGSGRCFARVARWRRCALHRSRRQWGSTRWRAVDQPSLCSCRSALRHDRWRRAFCLRLEDDMRRARRRTQMAQNGVCVALIGVGSPLSLVAARGARVHDRIWHSRRRADDAGGMLEAARCALNAVGGARRARCR